MFYKSNKVLIIVVTCLIASFKAYPSEATQGWSAWFTRKAEQYEKAAQAWIPNCKIFGSSHYQEFWNKPGAFVRSHDTTFGGKGAMQAAFVLDVVKSLACLSGTTIGATLGITKEAVSDIAHTAADSLELFYRGEISEKQAQNAIEQAVAKIDANK